MSANETLLKQIKDAIPERIPLVQVNEDDLGPWSISTLKSLEKCPLQFLLTKGLKVKAPEVLTEDSYVTYVGRAAHVWAEHIVRGESFDAAKKIAHEKHFHEVTDKYWHLVEDLTGNMLSFKQRLDDFGARNPIKDMHPELRLGLTKDFKKTDFFGKDVYFRGVIDLPIHLEANDALILDHKLGGDPSWGIRNYKRQLNTYKVMYHFGFRKIRGAQSGIHFLKEGEILTDAYSSKDEIENDFAPSIWMDIKDAVRNVQTVGKFNYGRGTQCSYCNFRQLCENGKRGTAGELQFVIEESKEIFK